MSLRGKGFRARPARPKGENLRSKESGQRERIQTPRSRTGEGLASIDACTLWRHAFPVSPGHVLIVPRRHEGDFFALSEREQEAMLRLIPAAREWVEAERSPGGYNLGVNIGDVAGQTIAHAHLHVIPRYTGDVPDPRGGVRWVLPERARYWNS